MPWTTLEKYVGAKKAASVAPDAREDLPNEAGAESMPQLECVNVPEGLARLGNDASLFIRLLLGLSSSARSRNSRTPYRAT